MWETTSTSIEKEKNKNLLSFKDCNSQISKLRRLYLSTIGLWAPLPFLRIALIKTTDSDFVIKIIISFHVPICTFFYIAFSFALSLCRGNRGIDESGEYFSASPIGALFNRQLVSEKRGKIWTPKKYSVLQDCSRRTDNDNRHRNGTECHWGQRTSVTPK